MHVHSPLEELVEASLAEDLGWRDITTEATVPADARCKARLVAKQEGVLSGIEAFHMAFQLMDAEIGHWQSLGNGDRLEVGQTVASFDGHTRAVLSGERTAMNFVQHLSGVASLTAAYVSELDGLPCKVSNTRKTTPMLRQWEKDAVVHGGGAAHRHNLSDGVLIKDNHITVAGGVKRAVGLALAAAHHLMRIEVEVRSLDEFGEALEAGAGVIMLDNMDIETMREAVKRAKGHEVLLEASGNATLERLRSMAETGVDLISVGALTHSAPALDMSLLIENI